MKNLAVYTVIIDDYDILKNPLHSRLAEEADFYCFTNTLMVSDFYKIVSVNKIFSSATLTNRYYKILSHPILSRYQYTVYLDGSFQIIADTLLPLIDQILKANDIAMFSHKDRSCVYEEAKAVILRQKANHRAVYQQVKRYSKEGFPCNNGLIEGPAIVRNHQSVHLQTFLDAWWREFYNNAHRDQLSFNYTLWKHPINLSFIPGIVTDNSFFRIHQHFDASSPKLKTLYEKIACRYWMMRVDMLSTS